MCCCLRLNFFMLSLFTFKCCLYLHLSTKQNIYAASKQSISNTAQQTITSFKLKYLCVTSMKVDIRSAIFHHSISDPQFSSFRKHFSSILYLCFAFRRSYINLQSKLSHDKANQTEKKNYIKNIFIKENIFLHVFENL